MCVYNCSLTVHEYVRAQMKPSRIVKHVYKDI